MKAAAHQLAVHIRALDDDRLNDLLVELPPARFTTLLEAAYATPQVGVPVRYHPARPRSGETSRWTVEARPAARAPVPAWAVLGAVTQERTAGPLCDVDGRGWPTRIRATAALLWHCPASGARCAALAAHVRALCDDALKDLLADLPPHRFTELLLAALDVTAEGGVAA